MFDGLDDYWKDLVRLLQVFTYFKKMKLDEISRIKSEMKNRVYKAYIAQKAKPKRTSPKSGQPVLFPTEGVDDVRC